MLDLLYPLHPPHLPYHSVGRLAWPSLASVMEEHPERNFEVGCADVTAFWEGAPPSCTRHSTPRCFEILFIDFRSPVHLLPMEEWRGRLS